MQLSCLVDSLSSHDCVISLGIFAIGRNPRVFAEYGFVLDAKPNMCYEFRILLIQSWALKWPVCMIL
jgi:hypothetical protein